MRWRPPRIESPAQLRAVAGQLIFFHLHFFILFIPLAVRSHFHSVANTSNFTHDGFPSSREAAEAY